MKDPFFNKRSDKGSHKVSRKRARLPPWLLAGMLLLTGLGPGRASGQPAKVKAAPSSDRCLLIVETSKAMQRSTDGILRSAEDALRSVLTSEFRDGGTLGVWTFNEDLLTGRFPLQTWSSSGQKDIMRRTLAFLKAQKYEKQSNLDKVAPALARVVKDSELITVILISSGDSQIRGTPFDDGINSAFRQGLEQQRKARMPFVTILRARKGSLGAYYVNTPPWPLQVPQLAGETNSAAKTHARLIEALYGPLTSTVPPLNISGNSAPPKPEPAKASNAVTNSLLAAPLTNTPTTVKPPASGKAEAAEIVAKGEAASLSASRPKTESATGPPPNRSEAAPLNREPAPVPSPPGPKSRPLANEHTNAAGAPGPNVESAVTASMKPQVQSTVSPQPAATRLALSNTPSGKVRSSSPPAPPAPAATATPTQSLWQRRNILIAGLLLAAVGIGAAVVIMRRPRGSAQGSLITRSFDRENKP